MRRIANWYRAWKLQLEVQHWEEELEVLEAQRIMHSCRVSVMMRRLQRAQKRLEQVSGLL